MLGYGGNQSRYRWRYVAFAIDFMVSWSETITVGDAIIRKQITEAKLVWFDSLLNYPLDFDTPVGQQNLYFAWVIGIYFCMFYVSIY